jgi:hypothetical protein
VNNKVVLIWNDRKNKLSIPLGKTDNVATFTRAPGYRKFAAFCATAELDYDNEQVDPIIATPAHAVSDDEDDVESTTGSMDSPSNRPRKGKLVSTGRRHIRPQFAQKGRPAIIEDEEDRQPTSYVAELLRYHHKFGHVLFKKLQEMAKIGTIPNRLAKCPVPACSACIYAKAIKRKWRSRTADNKEEAFKPTKPGERVSVDQLVLPTPGLIAQMTGFLTTKRYQYATVYVDQASRLSFVWLQKTATAEETLLGREAFEQYAKE